MKTQNKAQIRARQILLKRKNARGAAMVEGAIMLPVLAVFLGLLRFVHAEYDTKLLTTWDAHNETWAYASHGCVDGQGVVAGEPNQAADDASNEVSNGPGDAIQEESQGILGKMADSGKALAGAPGIVERHATGTAKVSRYQRTIDSKSWLFCNEQNYTGSLGVMSEFGNFAIAWVSNTFKPHK